MRSRNAVLQALALFKAMDPRVSVNEVICFLYAAENEGLTVQDTADLAGMTQSTASRSGSPFRRQGRHWALRPLRTRPAFSSTFRCLVTAGRLIKKSIGTHLNGVRYLKRLIARIS